MPMRVTPAPLLGRGEQLAVAELDRKKMEEKLDRRKLSEPK